MANVLELFSQSLNEAVAVLVVEALSTHTAQMHAMQLQLDEQEQLINEMSRTAKEQDVEYMIERAIDAYDFSEIVSGIVDNESMYDNQTFRDAVKEVISDALR